MGLRVKKKFGSTRGKPVAQAKYRRIKQRNTLRAIVGGVISLFVVAILGGVVYTWYVGTYQPVARQATPAPRKQIQIRPPAISQTARIGVSVQTVTTPVKLGDNASITIRTNRDASCSIEVEYDGKKATDSGLKPIKSDEFGTGTWSWTVEKNRPKGTWPIEVTCKNKKNSAVVASNFVVE